MNQLQIHKQNLRTILKQRAISFGNFTLASGQKSNYYINSKKAILNSEALWLTTEILYEMTKYLNIDAVGGLEVGAIPLVASLSQRFYKHKPVEGFFIRKQSKNHGSQDLIEGLLQPNMRVAVLDDVLTTGQSALQAINQIKKAGAEPVITISIVDRNQGAKELLKDYNYQSIFHIKELLNEPL